MTASTWGLAFDGSRARIVRDLETLVEGAPLPEELALEVHPHHLSDIMSDRPGRTHASVGTARSATENASDPVRDEARDFCEEVLWLLGTHLRRGDFDRLVVAADQRMLGVFRDRRNWEIARTTVGEVSRNFLHLDAADLRHRLRELMPVRAG
jgi:protein required for attachment to host cells